MTTLSPAAKHDTDQELAARIEARTAVVGVIGLGYVGLPLCSAFLQAGFPTMGFDLDKSKVRQLTAGKSYIRHPGSDQLAGHVKTSRFIPTTDMTRLDEPDVLVICVPTPLDDARDPDLSLVEATAREVADVLRPGQLVVLESTTYPGTTRQVVLPLLEQSTLTAGEDFFLAYSPEREDPGNPDHSANRIPKVVGGIDATSLRLAKSLYDQAVVRTVPVSSCEIAEASKILENTYRAVNIALVNELKVLFSRLGIDVWEVIEAASTKPFGFHPFYPGPGLGGHCIPIDPFYLSWLARRAGQTTRFIELAGEINASMPEYVVQRIAGALNQQAKPLRGSKVLVLGLAYKRDVDDPRESPAFRLLSLLLESGAVATYNDPLISVLPEMRHYDLPALRSEPLSPEFLRGQDCVVIVTDHSHYDYREIVRHSQLVVDTRNATTGLGIGADKIVKA